MNEVPEVEDGVLRAEHLTKSYAGRRVVAGVTITVNPGQVVGLLGPNGAGKTTTFYMIVGLTRPDAGRVYLHGADVTDLPMYQRARRGISYLPQEASVFRKLSVKDNLLAILETRPLSAAERRDRCAPRRHEGLCLVGGGAATGGDRAGACECAPVHAPRRALRWNRPDRGD
jgi:lipopolysaccharide export system ATP-binding protein